MGKKEEKIVGADVIGSEITKGISLLIYADPGIGKTTLAATLPVGETLISTRKLALVLSWERNTTSTV